MGSDWAKVKVADIASTKKGAIAIGPFGSRMKSDCYVAEGIPVIRGLNISSTKLFVGDFVYISSKKAITLGNANVYPGDIVFPHRGAIGQVAIVPNDDIGHYVLSSSLMKLTVNTDLVIPEFVVYFFRSSAGNHEILQYASTVGTPGIGQPLTSLRSMELLLPPLPEQKVIAHVLGSLDDRIELNRRMNETLEAMAQALFKSWFVDFDPVLDNAINAGKKIPDELTERADMRRTILDQNQNAECGIINAELKKHSSLKIHNSSFNSLFPDEFTHSDELGLIPKGWEVQPLYNIANFINGAAFKNAHFSTEPNALPIVKIVEIKNGVSEQTKSTTDSFEDKYRIDDGEILFSWSGNPDTSIDTFIWTGGPGWLNQHIFRVSLKSSQDHNFVYYLLKALRAVFAEIARDKQTTGLGHVTVKDMKNLYVLKPKDSMIDAFNRFSCPLFNKWYANLHGTRQLEVLRDTLLPKLLSGEIRIPDAEKIVEELAL